MPAWSPGEGSELEYQSGVHLVARNRNLGASQGFQLTGGVFFFSSFFGHAARHAGS